MSSTAPSAADSPETPILSQLRWAIMTPWWFAQIFTGAKSFERNLLIGSRLLNRWGLHATRVAVAHRLAGARRSRLAELLSADDRDAFDRDGFVLRQNFLPRDAFASLVAEIKAYHGPLREITEGDTIVRKIALSRSTLARFPALGALFRSREWRGLIRYVGSRNAEPVVWVQSILRHASPGSPDPQTLLHADTFHPTVKAWLFLTDVAEDAGPFIYVPGSHRLTAPRLAWERRMSLSARRSANPETRQGSFRIDAAELAALSLVRPRAFAVPANTLVVADTFGFHARGPSTRPSLRVEIWAYGRRSPFFPWTGLLPWTTTALGGRSELGWKCGDLLEWAGLIRHRWRARIGISAFDPPSDEPEPISSEAVIV
jgi:Phytanoyl-CoA dioxygenase (PhyH)